MKVMEVKKIYSDGNHNAFTGIVRFDNRYLVVFRNGTGHMSFDGKIKILASVDLETWTTAAEIIAPAGDDLRDPKIIVFQNRLLLYGGIRREVNGKTFNQSQLHTSTDGIHWEAAVLTGIDDTFWLWGLAAGSDRIFGAAYSRNPEGGFRCRLYRSADGNNWQPLYDFPTDANETALDLGPDGKLYALCRNENAPFQPEMFIFSDPDHPELNEHFTLNSVLQGPMIKRHDGSCLIAGRRWDSVDKDEFWSNVKDNPRRVDLLWLDDNRRVIPIATLPSGGDCSYAAWAQTNNTDAVLSYYSSHESMQGISQNHATANIYIAKLKLPAI